MLDLTCLEFEYDDGDEAADAEAAAAAADEAPSADILLAIDNNRFAPKEEREIVRVHKGEDIVLEVSQ